MRAAHGGSKSNAVGLHVQSQQRVFPGLELINVGLIFDHLRATGHRAIVDSAHKSIRQRLRVTSLNLLLHGRRIRQRGEEVKQPGLDGHPVLQRNQLPIAELATGMLKTLGGHNEITKANRAAHSSADACHDHHSRLPDAKRFGGGDGSRGQNFSS